MSLAPGRPLEVAIPERPTNRKIRDRCLGEGGHWWHAIPGSTTHEWGCCRCGCRFDGLPPDVAIDPIDIFRRMVEHGNQEVVAGQFGHSRGWLGRRAADDIALRFALDAGLYEHMRKHLRHGTHNAYTNWECRCEQCREFVRLSTRRTRKNRARTNRPPRAGRVPHGTITGYTGWACRCGPCSQAARDYAARRNSVELENKRARNAQTRPGARNWRKQWTGAELEVVALNPDRTAVELAGVLGRTEYAVRRIRRLLREDPQVVAIAGI